jgi:hypothetical protein
VQKIDCLHNTAVMELMRGLRNQLTELISGLGAQDLGPMSLGLSHSLSRYKLKFSPEKVSLILVLAAILFVPLCALFWLYYFQCLGIIIFLHPLSTYPLFPFYYIVLYLTYVCNIHNIL